MTTTAALVRTSTRPLLDLESFCRGAGLHPDFVRRLVALGLLEAEPGPAGELRFPPSQLAAAARLQRLRSGLGLNYAGLGLVVDLLDRVATLEAALRQRSAHSPLKQTTGGRPWT
jgi:chaperone modulatory protein CbpM